MSERSYAASGFAEFERRFLEQLHLFWRTSADVDLKSAADVLIELDDQVDHHNDVSDLQELVITGWVIASDGFRVRSRTLRQLNPGYDIRVERYARPELGRRARLFRAGFRVVATGLRDLPPFAFQVSNSAGSLRPLRTSNPDAAFQSGFFPRSLPDSTDEEAAFGFGFIDAIRQAPLADEGLPSTWLAALTLRFPAEVFDVVDSPHAAALAPHVARLATLFPSQALWADRLELSAFGAAGQFRSALTPVSVQRTDDGAPQVSEKPIRRPEMRTAGHVTRFVSGDQPLFAPDENWSSYQDAEVQDGGTVLVDDTLVVYEGSSDPRRDFVAGQQNSVYGSQTHPESALVRVSPRSSTPIDEAILLSGRNDANWFHWLVEYLPRVTQIDGSIAPDVPLLVSSRTPATGIEALHMLTDRPVVTVDAAHLQQVGRLYVLAPPVQILDTTRIPWSDGLRLNPRPLRAMREAWGLDHDAEHDGSAVFLRRRSRHRGLTNESRLVAIAERHGMEIRDPGSMSFRQQLDLFSSARLLVGASGAVMANYLMMSRGSQVLGLTSDALTDFILPAALAEVAGAKFTYISGPPSRPLTDFTMRNDWIQSDFSVDAVAFETALVQALADDSN